MGSIEIWGPIWFYKLDTIIQFFGAIVALLIAYYTYKAYKLSSKRSHLYFSLAFALISLNLMIYSVVLPIWAIVNIGSAFIVDIISRPLLLTAGQILNFLYIFSYFMAYALLIFVYSKIERRSMIAIVTLLTLIIALYSSIIARYYPVQTFTGFNIIGLLLLSFIVYFTYNNHKQKKSRSSGLVLSAFLLISASHLLTIFVSLNGIFFVFGHIAQLIGYISLLMVTKT